MTTPPGGALVRALSWRLILFSMLGLPAFAPLSWTPLIFLALVPYIDAVRLAAEARAAGRHGALAGWIVYLGGSLYFMLLLHWLVFLPAEEITVPGLMIPATIVAGLYLGLYAFAAQWLGRRLARWMPLGFGVAIAWVAMEYVRTQSQLGCPWGLLGYGLTGTPVLMQTAALWGVFGVSLLVALVGAALHVALRADAGHRGSTGGRRRRRALTAAAVLVAAMWIEGSVAERLLPPAETIEVALIQPDMGRDVKFVPALRAANVRRLLELSLLALEPAGSRSVDAEDAAVMRIDAGGRRPDLVIWPETAAPCRLQHDAGCQQMLRTFTDATGVPIFTGFPAIELVDDGEPLKWNASALVMPELGIVDTYSKVNLVPFGEAVPYQDRFAVLRRIDFGEADFSRGAGFDPVALPGAPFGVMICYESIFPAPARVAVRRGARFLVNITNDEWFGDSAGPYQHAAMAVVRAIECRRGLARCANTGVSFVVDRRGVVHHPTPLYTEAIVTAPVELGNGSTWYMRTGDWVAWVCLLVAIGGAIVPDRRRR